MKVGIITFHFADNYGAMLQVYALQATLMSNGVEVEVINYRPSYIYDKYRMNLLDIIKHPRHFFYSIVQYNYKKIQHEKFSNFLSEFINQSKREFKIIPEEIEAEYDYFITGSDQVWNPFITGRDNTYFLNFLNNSGKKIAYAASIGKNIDSDIEEFVLENTKEFKKVSIREEQIAKHFNELGREFETVLDPTLLLSKEEWLKIESAPLNVPQRYVLVYDLECRKDILEMALKKANEENIELVTIHPLDKKYHGHLNLLGVGPKEFVYLFHHAEYVFTNSFHGLVFSTIFNKKVFVVEHSVGNSRLENLINTLKLEVKAEVVEENCKANMYLNGKETKNLIEMKVNHSLKFLFNSLDE